MSRKNLSRTVIEGGRYHGNQVQRRASHRTERATTRAWLHQVEVDLEDAESKAPPPRPPVAKSFHDKLGPARRWLASQVGRPWNKVYQELCAKFDRRTIAGNHVVQSHMLGWVDHGNQPTNLGYRNRDFIVDPHGILRRGRLYDRSWSKLRAEALAWAAGRRAASTHMGWWWFHVSGVGEMCVRSTCTEPHASLYDGPYYRDRYHQLAYVADRPLDRADKRRLELLTPDLCARIVIRWP